MKTYDIHMSPKPDHSVERIIELAKDFAERLQAQQLIVDFQLHRIVDKGNFDAMPQLKMINFFKDDDHFQASMAAIRQHFMSDETHQSLMHSVSDFKVTFSEFC